MSHAVCVLPAFDGRPLSLVHTVHHWLYKYAGILHRDISPNNIMWRFIEEKNVQGSMERRVYGVLADYDLSSFTATMNSDYKKTSQQRTGTPPYMAQELLKGKSSLHLYRHDLESLFYIMLLTAARHMIGTPEGEDKPRVILRESWNLPFKNWFNETCYHTLGSLKGAFFSDMQPITLSRDFEDFFPWLKDLQQSFSSGFSLGLFSSNMRMDPILRAAFNSTVAEFNDGTLGGRVTYATIMARVPHLTGELQGLVIRDPEYQPVPVEEPPVGTATS